MRREQKGSGVQSCQDHPESLQRNGVPYFGSETRGCSQEREEEIGSGSWFEMVVFI